MFDLDGKLEEMMTIINNNKEEEEGKKNLAANSVASKPGQTMGPQTVEKRQVQTALWAPTGNNLV